VVQGIQRQRSIGNLVRPFAKCDIEERLGSYSRAAVRANITATTSQVAATEAVSTLRRAPCATGREPLRGHNPARAASLFCCIAAAVLCAIGTGCGVASVTNSTNSAASVPDFNVSESPASQSVVAGTSTTYAVQITPSNGFSGAVSLSASGLPANATASFSALSSSGTSTLTVTTATTTPAGTANLTITATSGSIVHSTAATLTVSAAPTPDFSIAATPATASVVAGSSTTYAVQITPRNGFSGAVSLSASGLPANATASFSALSSSGTSTLTVTTATTTPAGTANLTITGSSGGLAHSTSVKLTVSPTPDFAVTSTPAAQTVVAGSTVTYTLTTSATAGFNGSIAFAATGLPSGVTATFNPSSVIDSGSSTAAITTVSTVALGSYAFAFTATSGSLVHTSPGTLTIDALPSGRNYYVSPTGSDSNNGSASAPWQTLQQAAKAIVGDLNGVTVHVAAGTYTGSLTTSLNGSASAHIQFISDTPLGAKLDAQGTDYAWTMTGDYEDIVGFEITNAARAGVRITGSHTRVLNSKLHDIAVNTPCDSGGGAAVEPDSYSNSDMEVSNSIIYNVGPGAGTTRCNSIHGIYFAVPTGRAVNNLITTITGDCITSWHYATTLAIANNTVEGCLDAGILIGADATTMDNTVVANNIVLNSNYGIAEEGNLGSHNTYVDNLLSGNATNFQWVTGSASGTIVANPLLINNSNSAASGNYRLQNLSPAVDHGANQYCPTTDLDGFARPHGLACDIGAYEWHP